MYTALYRKYRPMNFAGVVGQESIVTTLKNQVQSGRVAHSYIFTGTRGTGKTSCAKIFARAINCENPHGGEPCGVCPTCVGLQNGSIFDVAEIDAASNNGVDDVRELREETAYIPAACRYRVYIIDEVHMLSTSAFNALLKIMEEPPAHVVFILATTEIHKVPATILSRCQRFDFNRVAPHFIEELLLDTAGKEGLELEKPAAALLARLADGAVRDALSLLDTCISAGSPITEDTVAQVAGVANKDYLFALSDAVFEKNLGEALMLLNGLLGGALDVRRLLEELVYHYRNILLCTLGTAQADMLGVGAAYFERYCETAKAQGQGEAVRAVSVLGDALGQLGKGADARIQLELAVFTLCGEQDVQVQKPAPAKNIPMREPAAPAAKPMPAENPKAVPSAKPLSASAQQDAPPWDVQESDAPPFEAAPPATEPPVARSRDYPSTVEIKPITESAPAAKPTHEGDLPLFEHWDAVVAKVGETDKLLHANLVRTKAYRSGRRVLIEGSGMFLEYMRTNEYSATILKKAIEDVSGEAMSIGPYKPQTAEKPAKNESDGLARLQEMDVPIEYV